MAVIPLLNKQLRGVGFHTPCKGKKSTSRTEYQAVSTIHVRQISHTFNLITLSLCY